MSTLETPGGIDWRKIFLTLKERQEQDAFALFKKNEEQRKKLEQEEAQKKANAKAKEHEAKLKELARLEAELAALNRQQFLSNL